MGMDTARAARGSLVAGLALGVAACEADVTYDATCYP